ncbi:MAG: GIY-YIG nuclease family protein [Endomicrobium sp.]|jgi:sulfur relay (sulfurtransferase) DsrF/TusC family protein|nr:GIY-YIG nuclease family protein [Endomicrobium sp.]
MANQFIYIVQASKELSFCKIGRTDDLERRLKEYNNMTGKSKDNIYEYLFTCEVSDMVKIENVIKVKFGHLREDKSKEIYFYNSGLFEQYVNFIKSHNLFVRETFIKLEPKNKIVKIKVVKKTTPSLEERGLTRENIITKAKKIDNDEFYTRYEDIKKEIEMYDAEIWCDKVIFCNCDDAVDTNETGHNPRNTSAFALYFLQNFQELGLKKLICTHYSGKVDLFNQGSAGYIFTKDGFSEFGTKEHPKGYTGSFADPLSIKILNEEVDIVCTNPPFSRAIEYWKITIESGKKFLFISNIVNILNTAFIPYFKNNKVWPGYNSVDWYLNPKRETVRAAGHWYTNLPINNRPKYKQLKIMPLKDIPTQYKKYDDSGLLLVDNNFIPEGYKKSFGVSSRPLLNGLLEKGYKIINDKQYIPYINGKPTWSRIIVRKV